LGKIRVGGRGAGRKVRAEQEHISVQCETQVEVLLLLALHWESWEKQQGKLSKV